MMFSKKTQEAISHLYKVAISTLNKVRVFIISHWRGELNLATSFWFNGFLILCVQGWFFEDKNYWVCGYPFPEGICGNVYDTVFSVVFYYVHIVWWIIGCWRSANNYMEEEIRYGDYGWGFNSKYLQFLTYCILLAFTIFHLVNYENILSRISRVQYLW